LSINVWIRMTAGVAVVLAFLVHEAEWFQYRPVQQMELFAYDARLRLFMPRTLDPRVIILDIDEKSLNAEGRWPWSRNKLAVMVKQLFDHYKVRVVGFDVAFAEPDPSSGLASLEALAKGERKDDAEFQAWMEKARLTLDYDRAFAEVVSKYPVVLGYFLGGIEFLQQNIEAAVILIVLISATPIFIEIFRGWRERRRGTAPAAGASTAPTEGRHRSTP